MDVGPPPTYLGWDGGGWECGRGVLPATWCAGQAQPRSQSRPVGLPSDGFRSLVQPGPLSGSKEFLLKPRGCSRQEYWSRLPWPPPGASSTPRDRTRVSYMFSALPDGGSDGKVSACKAGDLGSIPWSGRSPGGTNGNPLQYACLENPMDGGTWQATVHRVTKSRTRLSDLTSLPPGKAGRAEQFILCQITSETHWVALPR